MFHYHPHFLVHYGIASEKLEKNSGLKILWWTQRRKGIVEHNARKGKNCYFKLRKISTSFFSFVYMKSLLPFQTTDDHIDCTLLNV